jgi:hypothetical protein
MKIRISEVAQARRCRIPSLAHRASVAQRADTFWAFLADVRLGFRADTLILRARPDNACFCFTFDCLPYAACGAALGESAAWGGS